jgi:hypothetical protein
MVIFDREFLTNRADAAEALAAQIRFLLNSPTGNASALRFNIHP